MKNIYIENYKTLRQELKNILYLCLILILSFEFFLFDIPELFPKASTLGNIIIKLCYSYISALLFYYLVVHFKRQNEKRNFYKVLDKKLNTILNQGKNLSNRLNKISEDENFDPLVIKNLTNVLTKINPKKVLEDITYTSVGNVNWYYHLLFQSQKTRAEIDLIFKNSYLLEAEIISILNELYNCRLFMHFELFSPMLQNLDDENLKFYDSKFEDYFKKLNDLEKYRAKEVDRYIS